MGQEKCLWGAMRNRFNSPTKIGKLHRKTLKKKLCSVLARREWWFWYKLLFGILKNFTVGRPNRAISWEKIEQLTFDWKGKWSSHVDFTKKLFASMLDFLLRNRELKESETMGKTICSFSLLQSFCLLNFPIWHTVS